MTFFSGNAVAQLIFQSDSVSKAVLLVLLSLSIVCWTVFLHRFFLLRVKIRQLKQARSALASAHTLEQLTLMVSTLQETYAGFFLVPAH